MSWVILNLKFLFAKLYCRIFRINILHITEPPIPEVPFLDVVKLITEDKKE